MVDHTSRARAVPAWSCAALVAGTSAIFWWLTGLNQYNGPDRIVGPFDVPIALEITFGISAAVAMLIALAVRPMPRIGHGVAWAPTALLVLTGLVATGSWRVITLGGDGANIGGAAALLMSPFLVSGLLIWAVFAERTARTEQLRWLPMWLTVAALPAVGGIVLWTS